MVDVSKEVESTVKDGSGFSDMNGAEQAYRKMQTDVATFQTQHAQGTQEYKDYVSGVAAGLEKAGTLPALSVFWAQDTLHRLPAGQHGLKSADIQFAADAAKVDPNLALSSALATGLQSKYDQLKGANIDLDPATDAEMDMITPADLVQARKFGTAEASLLSCQGQVTGLTGERDTLTKANGDLANQVTGLTGERDTLTKANGDLANQVTGLTGERDTLNKDNNALQAEKTQLLAQRDKEDSERRQEHQQATIAEITKKAQLQAGNGEGYWHLASRLLNTDGHKHKNNEIVSVMKHLQDINHNRALLKGEAVQVMSVEEMNKALAESMKVYDERESKRRSP